MAEAGHQEGAAALTGGCHCGGVRYRLASAPLIAYACHCTNCQKISASAFAVSCVVPEAAMTIETGAPARVSWTADSGKERFGDFCPTCGGRLRHGDAPSRGVFVVRGGTLDDTRWARPGAHIWTASAQDWVRFSDSDLVYEGQPSDYGPIAARYQALTAELR